MRTLLLTLVTLVACGGGDDDGGPDGGQPEGSLLISNKTDVTFTSIDIPDHGNVLTEPLGFLDNVIVPDVVCGNYGVDVTDDFGAECYLEVELCETWFIDELTLEQCIGQ